MACVDCYCVTTPDPVYEGAYSLKLVDDEASGTPRALLGWVAGLQDGDVVTVSFWRYDTTPAGAPSCRLWANYTMSGGDIDSYAASAGGNSDYGPGEGWDLVEWTWEFESDLDTRNGLAIQCRTYSNPGDVVWIDEITIIGPDDASIQIADCYPVVDLAVTDIDLVWTPGDFFTVAAETEMHGLAALNQFETVLECFVDDWHLGDILHAYQDYHDGVCWTSRPHIPATSGR